MKTIELLENNLSKYIHNLGVHKYLLEFIKGWKFNENKKITYNKEYPNGQ